LLEPLSVQHALLVREMDPDEPVTVLADPRRLRQVLLNVVSNALKYNRADGEVEISTRLWDGEVTVAVRDTGEGIAPELTDRLFTPFDRLGAETGGEPGAGLGLVVTERLVTAMGGRLRVSSRVGVGTTVSIAFPAFAGTAFDDQAVLTEGPEEPVWRDRPAARGRVLYVEDDAAHRLLVAEILRARPGIELTMCARGSEALALLRHDSPDLLLVDLDLPDMRGEDILAAADEDLPVCVLSGRHPTDGLPDGSDSTGIPWLTKPLDGAALLATLDDLLAT
jgi:CheY-like chemotaxis protein